MVRAVPPRPAAARPFPYLPGASRGRRAAARGAARPRPHRGTAAPASFALAAAASPFPSAPASPSGAGATGRLGRPRLLPALPPLGRAELRCPAADGSCSPAPAPAGSGGAGGSDGRLQPPQCRGAARRGPGRLRRAGPGSAAHGGGGEPSRAEWSVLPHGETPRECGFTSRLTRQGSAGAGERRGRGRVAGGGGSSSSSSTVPLGTDLLRGAAGLPPLPPGRPAGPAAGLPPGRRAEAGAAAGGAGETLPRLVFVCATLLLNAPSKIKSHRIVTK